MLDDDIFNIDFGNEGGDTTTAATTAATPAVTHEQFTELQGQVAAATAQSKRAQDALRFAAGLDAPNQQPDLGAILQQNPNAFAQTIRQETVNTAVQAAVAQVQVENLINQAKAARPDLTPFEDVITHRANQLADQYQRQGKTVAPKEVIAEAIKEFDGRLQTYQSGTRDQQNAQKAKEAAMPFEVGNGSSQGKVTMGEAIERVGLYNPKGWNQVRNQFYAANGIRPPQT